MLLDLQCKQDFVFSAGILNSWQEFKGFTQPPYNIHVFVPFCANVQLQNCGFTQGPSVCLSNIIAHSCTGRVLLLADDCLLICPSSIWTAASNTGLHFFISTVFSFSKTQFFSARRLFFYQKMLKCQWTEEQVPSSIHFFFLLGIF